MPQAKTIILFFATIVLLAVNVSTFGEEEQPKSSIRLQKWQFYDAIKNKALLTLRLGNYSDRAVNVNEIALTSNTWTTVGQTIEPGKTLTLKYSIENAPAYVTVSTTVGKFRLELNPENESR